MLNYFRTNMPAKLSAGEKQRAAFALLYVTNNREEIELLTDTIWYL